MSGNTRAVMLRWTGEGMAFSGRGTLPESPEIFIDGDAGVGPSPVHLLLLAAAACSGADVVHILKKMKVDLRALSVEVSGERRTEDPKRFENILLHFHADVPQGDRSRVGRAVDLSIETYCSVVHSLSADIEIKTAITFE